MHPRVLTSAILCLVVLCLTATPIAARCTNCTQVALNFTTSVGYLLQYYAADPTVSLGSANSTVTTAIFAIHGTSRDGGPTYCYVDRGIIDSQNLTLDRSKYLIFSPEYPQVVDSFSDASPSPPPNFIYWPDDSWKEGGQSTSNLTKALSSFTIIEEMMKVVLNKTLYPNINKIILIGHSAGGQFVHRFAVTNRFEPTANAAGVKMVYGAANPSSYTYFDTRRPSLPAGTCATYCNQNEIEVTQWQFGPAVNASTCTKYNDWPYGLDNRYPYAAGPTANTLMGLYGPREVYYILGANDTCNELFACGCNDTGLDGSCYANLQGWCRLSRGYAYFAYLKSLNIAGFNHTILEIPNLGHVTCTALQAYLVRLVIYGGSPVPPTAAPTLPPGQTTSPPTTPSATTPAATTTKPASSSSSSIALSMLLMIVGFMAQWSF